MPYHKSAKKELISAEKSKVRNRATKSRISTAIKHVETAKTKDVADKALKQAFSVIDKAAKTNVIHKKNAANKKSRLALLAQKVSG
jgi:small subunit ribosomal protein S20